MDRTVLKLNEMFWSFQGEGYHAGRRALFVRVPKCNLKCHFCDTEYDQVIEVPLTDFTAFATEEIGRFAVLTGGEPTINAQTPQIINMLQSLGFYVAMETNGTKPPPSVIPDWITCSPKEQSCYEIDEKLYPLVNEFKYVVDNNFNFEILDRHRDDDTAFLYLSPESSAMYENLKKIYIYIRKNPKWRISLQTHKWMGIK